MVAVLLPGCSLLGIGGPEYGAEVLYVSPTGDDNATGDAPDEPLRSLAVAVDAVADGGTIKMAEGFYSVSEIAFIWKDVTIEGGLTADFSAPAYDAADVLGSSERLSVLSMRDAYGRIVHVYAPNADQPLRRVSISGLSFNAAFFNSNGAAMGTDGRTDLQLEHCVFSNNTSNGKAGALHLCEQSCSS